MTRYHLLALLLLASPALAADYTGFIKDCTSKGPVDICTCMAEELDKTRDGKVVLDTYVIAAMPEAERKPAMAAMMERYKITQAELGPIGNAIPAMLEAAGKVCDE
jgi:hypothetical protein